MQEERGFPDFIRRLVPAPRSPRARRPEFEGRTYVLERGLRADLAIIHAWKADREGNLIYRKTARNFNPIMATAAKVTVAEVEELVEPGQIPSDHIVTPGIFVDRIVPLTRVEKRIEQRTLRKRQ